MKLSELRQRKDELARSFESLIDNPEEFGKAERELAELEGLITRAQKAQDIARGAARPVGEAAGAAANEAVITPSQMLRFQSSREIRSTTWGAQDYVNHARGAIGFTLDPQKHFSSLGEQLAAVARAY